MPYDIKITQVQEGFIGHVSEKGQVLFQTSPLKDTNSVTNELSNFIKNKAKTDKIQAANAPQKPQGTPTDVSQFRVPLQVNRGLPSKSSCCGRG